MTNLFADADPSATERDDILNKWKDKTKEEILEAKVNSDLFVKTLTRRQDETTHDLLEAKKQLEAMASLQELTDKLNVQQTPSISVTPQANEVREPKIDPKEIEGIVQKQIHENELNKIRTNNAREVQSKLRERYGSHSASILKEQAETLGLSESRVNELAQESPAAFFKLMGLDQQNQETFQAPPRSNQRNDTFSPRVVKRDYAYYQEMKKSNPKLYLDPKIAVQMHNDVISQGESAFYGQN